MSTQSLTDQLFDEILMARQRVYAAGQPTPLQRLDLPFPSEVYVKREDLGPIRAYKWRGAFNRMATLTNDELRRNGFNRRAAAYQRSEK